MTADDLEAYLEDSKDEIKAAVKAKLIDAIANDFRYGLPSEVKTLVGDFIEAEIIPEVKKYLVDEKGPILQAALAACATIGDELAKGLALKAAKSISEDYQQRQVLKALFGSYC